jgi:Asp-tRNA(Asn)/Glu-tRNA(Gln) amidotransferase C subunit
MNDTVKTQAGLCMLNHEGEVYQKDFSQMLAFLKLPKKTKSDTCLKPDPAACLREDVCRKGIRKDVFLASAPSVLDGYVTVPSAVKEAEGS